MSTAGIYNKLKKNEQFGGQIQMMDEDTDWLKLK
jgi:hypothetical protein